VNGDIFFLSPDTNGNAGDEAMNLAKLDPRGRRIRKIRGGEIAMVFQEPMTSLSPVHTIANQIMEAILLHQDVSKKEAREQAIEMLRLVNMPKPEQVIDNYPHQLSGGMRQRAMIAMALSCKPTLLIADEPTTALDVTTEAQILELMRSLQERLGMAILYITHNLGVIAEMTEDVIVMYLGKVVERGDVDSIFHDPKHPYTRDLLKSIPNMLEETEGTRLQAIEGMVPDPFSLPTGCSFHPRCQECIAGVCDVEEPPDIDLGNGRYVRCHLYSEEQVQS
jgi:peptide/nickel transport system ATP-binding protein